MPRWRRHGGAASRRRRQSRRRARAARPPRAGRRDLPRRCGRAGTSTGAKKSGATILATALDLGAEFVDVEWRAVEGQSTGVPFATSSGEAPNASSCRRTTSTAFPPIWSRARARCGATGAGTIKIAVSVESRSARRCCLKSIATRRPRRRHRHGRARGGVAAAGEPLRIALDVRRRRRGAGADSRAPDDRRLRIPRVIGPSTRIFGVVSTNALHSLSPVMHNAAFAGRRHRCRLRAAAGSRLRRLPDVRRGHGHRGRQRHDSVQARCAACGGSSDALTQQVGAANTLRRSGDAVGKPRTPTSRDFCSRSDAAWAIAR